MAGKIRFLLYRDGRYYARRVVPQELRAIIEKNELREPLGADYRRAVDRLNAALVIINAKIEHAKALLAQQVGAAANSKKAAAAPMAATELARAHYNERLAVDQALRNIGPTWASIGHDDGYVLNLREVLAGKLDNDRVSAVIGDILRKFQLRGNLTASPGSPDWRESARLIADAELEYMGRMVDRDDGLPVAQEIHPPHLRPAIADAEHAAFEPPVSLRGLLEDHIKHLEASGRGKAARKAWPRVFDDLVDFVKQHRDLKGRAIVQADDARRLTPEEIIAWRDQKLLTHSTRTMKDVWLAALKAALRHAVEDRKIPSNPAADVKVRHTAAPKLREKGYSDSEAVRILRASRCYVPSHQANPANSESLFVSEAKRWGPWLCALTGARIAELMQLRTSDIGEENGVAFFHITPDAGSVKSRVYRNVPMHRQLVDLGFLDFVSRSEPGPLFFKPTANPQGAAQTVAGRLSTWLGKSGLIPSGVQPNHAWRHRFKAQSMDLGLDERVIGAIQGHAGRSSSDTYGDVSMAAKKRAIDVFPAYEIGIL